MTRRRAALAVLVLGLALVFVGRPGRVEPGEVELTSEPPTTAERRTPQVGRPEAPKEPESIGEPAADLPNPCPVQRLQREALDRLVGTLLVVEHPTDEQARSLAVVLAADQGSCGLPPLDLQRVERAVDHLREGSVSPEALQSLQEAFTAREGPGRPRPE